MVRTAHPATSTPSAKSPLLLFEQHVRYPLRGHLFAWLRFVGTHDERRGMGSKRTLSQSVELTGQDILLELPIPSLRFW